MSVNTATDEHESFTHPAFFYRSDEEYLDGLLPFITDGLAQHEPVAVAVPESRLALLRGGLGNQAGTVTMLDMGEVGRNPGRIIAGVLRPFADAHPDGRVRIVGEPIWPGRTEAEYPACVQHEALINAAFTGRGVSIVCPYDAAGLDARALADARATHPVVWQAGHEQQPSEHYTPEAVHQRYNQRLAHNDRAAVYSVTSAGDLSSLRRHVAHEAAQLGLGPAQAEDLELVATELATNSLTHARGSCELHLWREGDHVICEVRDTGHFTDPLDGRRPPRPGQRSGRGLLLVHDLADLVRLHTTRTGTAIHAYLRVHRH